LALTKCAKRHKNFAFRERVRQAANRLCNDLETAVLPRYPVIGSIKSALMENGALGSLMAGSGACVFGLFAGLTEAESAFERISSARKWQLHLVDMIV
jgi:4-diphosphocytidyl-2-C-methyl-D-erythritol kinase